MGLFADIATIQVGYVKIIFGERLILVNVAELVSRADVIKLIRRGILKLSQGKIYDGCGELLE